MLRLRNPNPSGLGGDSNIVTLIPELCSINCVSSAVLGFSVLPNPICLENETTVPCAAASTLGISYASVCGAPKSAITADCKIVQTGNCQSQTGGTTFMCDGLPAKMTSAFISSTSTETVAPGATIATPVTQSINSSTATAVASATTSPSGKFITKPKASGLNGGAAAGLAVGCLIAGAVIAALIFFFLFQRYKKREHPKQSSSGYMNHLHPYNGSGGAPAAVEKALPTVTANAKSPAIVSAIDTYLPQPAEDDAISGELSRLRDKIKNHAQTFYHMAEVDPVMVDESEFQDVAKATGIRSMTLCDMLLNPQTRIATIRLLLSYTILSRSGGQNDARTTLLPPEVALFVDSLARVDGSNAGQLVLKSKWQSISGTLLASGYSSSNFSDSDARNYSITTTITAIDGVLRPFVSPHQDDVQRLRNLQGVVQRAASFAFLLFSQPSTFKFQWSAHGELTVFPALVQMTDENAHVLNPPRTFLDLEVA